MADDVFGATKTDETPASVLSDLVGEGKKFKTVDDLARGKAEADTHISNLEKELAEMRKQLNPQFDAEKTLGELRAEIQALKNNPDKSRSQEVTPPGLTEDRIAALVTQELTRAEQNRTVSQNVTVANNAMVEHFGSLEAAGTAVNAKAAELGMSLNDLKGIAAKSPTAFQKIMLGDASKASEAPLNPQGTNTAALTPQVPNNIKPGTKEYFENLMKTDRKKYWSPEVQMQLHKAVKEGSYVL